MGKKNLYKLTLTTPIIAALIAPSVAYADTPTAQPTTDVPAAFTAPETPSSSSELVDVNNTKVVELSNEERLRLKNVYLDNGDVVIDVVGLNNLQNEAARKAQARADARAEAMDKFLTSIDATRNELAAKADAEKKAEDEAKAKVEAEKKKAEELAAKALAEAKANESTSNATGDTSPSGLNATGSATVVSTQANTQRAYTPTSSVATNNNTSSTPAPSNGVYASNFDVRVDKSSGKAASTTVDTSNLDATRAAIVETAKTGLGGTYIWGGKTFRAWDCSGFVSWVYAQQGIKLTAYTYAMATELKVTSNPKPGDIVFQNGYSHVGIYLGDGKMISALNPSEGTLIHSTSIMPVDGYYTAL